MKTDRPSHPALARRRRERRALLDTARSYVDAADASEYELLAGVVFGSVARGDFNKWSDIDLLLVVEEAPDRWLDRVDRLPPPPGLVQPVVWTRGEWRVALKRGNPMATESLERGVWLKGRPELLAGS